MARQEAPTCAATSAVLLSRDGPDDELVVDRSGSQLSAVAAPAEVVDVTDVPPEKRKDRLIMDMGR